MVNTYRASNGGVSVPRAPLSEAMHVRFLSNLCHVMHVHTTATATAIILLLVLLLPRLSHLTMSIGIVSVAVVVE